MFVITGGCTALRRFLLIFAILFLAPIIGHAATCTSTETVTKCAKIPTRIYGYEYTNGQYTSDSWSLEYNDVVLSGNSASTSGFDTTISGSRATCTINSPFNASIDGVLGPLALEVDTAYQACARVNYWDTKTFSFTSKLDGDICPDGFYTVPYNVSCGAGMVDTANVPNCSDDTSGESCLIPATSAPAPEVLCAIGISQIKISTGVSFALYAEKYTQPSLAIKYNDGICYGKLEQGNQSGTMNFNYNGTVYHLAN